MLLLKVSILLVGFTWRFAGVGGTVGGGTVGGGSVGVSVGGIGVGVAVGRGVGATVGGLVGWVITIGAVFAVTTSTGTVSVGVGVGIALCRAVGEGACVAVLVGTKVVRGVFAFVALAVPTVFPSFPGVAWMI